MVSSDAKSEASSFLFFRAWTDEGVLVRGGLQVNGVSAIARADVARVLLRALTTGAWRLASLRFDLCAATTGAPTAPTADALDHVLTSAQWPWAR